MLERTLNRTPRVHADPNGRQDLDAILVIRRLRLRKVEHTIQERDDLLQGTICSSRYTLTYNKLNPPRSVQNMSVKAQRKRVSRTESDRDPPLSATHHGVSTPTTWILNDGGSSGAW